MGIADRDLWLLREAYPSGRATGWRRVGYMALLVGALVLIVVALVIASAS